MLLVLIFLLTTTKWFLAHDNYPGMFQSGYSLRLNHADCDIVIYGDSTSLTGLDPDIIQNITGLKTCNVSEGVTIQEAAGSRFPLDAYLAHNRRPKYLLAMYSAETFRPYIEPFDQDQPEGMLYLAQYDLTRQTLLGFLRKRDWTVHYDLWAGRQIISYFTQRLVFWKKIKPAIDTRAQRDARHGIWPYPFPPETKCVRTAENHDPKEFQRYADAVARFRSIYSIDGTTVLVNIAPIPTCDVLQQLYRKNAQGLHDNKFETLPISYFNEGDVHFSQEGSRYISIEAANQILALERKSAQGGPRESSK
jgi:hypothetical protein